IINGIDDSRANIQRLKAILRSWDVIVEDLPDDGEVSPFLVSTHTQPVSPPALPPPISLNHQYICYAPRDGAQHAQRLHAALQQAGARPWLDQRDTPAGYDPEAAREEALRECASVLLVLTPASANVQSDSAGEWRRALQFKKPIVAVRFAP